MTARPGRIERSLRVDVPRPRGAATLTSAEFNRYKREIMAPMCEESLLAARS